MSSYGTKLPPPLLAPSSFSLRGASYLIVVAFLVSMAFMGIVMHSLGVDGITLNQLQSGKRSLTTLRFDAIEAETDSVSLQTLQHLGLLFSDATEDYTSVEVMIAFNHDYPVTPGQFVPMNEAQTAPSVSIKGDATSSAERYTFVLVDIDAPDPKAPTHAPFLHYILSGLTTQDQARQQHKVVVVPYYPVSPPIGEHRYLSLLFRQKESGPNAPNVSLAAQRRNFDVAGFAKTYALDLVATSSFHSHSANQGNEHE